MSPITPPPNPKIASVLEIFFFKRKFKICSTVFNCLVFSPGFIIIVSVIKLFGIDF